MEIVKPKQSRSQMAKTAAKYRKKDRAIAKAVIKAGKKIRKQAREKTPPAILYCQAD